MRRSALRTRRSPELLRIADFTTPSVFLETILSGPMQGRRKLYSRLGMAARDPIDELMNSALEFERNETASLDRFLAWFSRGTVDVQRDPGRPGNEVRVMTVHGAKGLEAPVVILADATADPARLGRTPITLDFEIGSRGASPLLRPKKEERCPPFEEAIVAEEKRDLEEHWRLLYVALTRAADRLIVAGVAPKPKKDGSEARPANCWHVAVERALVSVGAEPVDDGKWGAGLVYGVGGTARGKAEGREEADCLRSPFPSGREPPLRPRRGRRGRSRHPPSPPTTKARRRRARRCARRRSAAPGFTSCSSGLPVGRSRQARGRRRSLARTLGRAGRRSRATRDRRAGLRDHRRQPLLRLVRRGLAWRSAARRHAAAMAG